MTQAALERFARECMAGEVLFREGEAGTSMFVLRSGRVQLSTRVRDHEMVLAEIGPGEFFGEMALLSGQPRSATARVVEPAILLEIDRQTFESMIRANTEIAVRMIQRLAARLAWSNHHIQTLLLKDHPSRVASYLLGELRARGLERGEIVLDRTHVQRQAGCTEEELDDALRTLMELGLVQEIEGAYTIPDAFALACYVETPTGAARAS